MEKQKKNFKYKEIKKMGRNEILKKIQQEGLAILKLHEKLNELNIEHEFIDRKEERIKMLKENKEIDIITDIFPFDYQIIIHEDGNEISLVQSNFTYGITENLIEVYNFQHEPIILDHEMAAALISKKKLNSYIMAVFEKNDEDIKKIFDDLINLCDTNSFNDPKFGG